MKNGDKCEVVNLKNITKRYGGVTALNNVNFSVVSGEIHAVVGENGAGKSTMMKLLSGIVQPDEGKISILGKETTIQSPRDAEMLGIAMVFQELNLFDPLTVAANIFINNEISNRTQILDEKEMYAEALKVLGSLQVDIRPTDKVSTLSPGQKQIVEIARAIHRGTGVVIMDEPNSALNEQETQSLFKIIRQLKESGLTILYVSHRLEEVFRIADRITVLRDGNYIGTWERAETSIEEVVTKMVGRKLGEVFPPRAKPPSLDITLKVDGLIAGIEGKPVSFYARKGEVLGFAGLEGSGVANVFNTLFGLIPAKAGVQIMFNGSTIEQINPANLITKGWAYIPANRRHEGLMLDWSILKNVSIVIITRLLNKLGLIRRKPESDLSSKYIERLNIATDSKEKIVGNLSGGNQQKVVLAKWLAINPSLVILNDPTRGIDVGTKQEIYRLIAEWANQGFTVLITSSEIEEILGVCHRILVMYRGELIKEFDAQNTNKEEVMRYVLGGAAVDQDAHHVGDNIRWSQNPT
jgi:ABC-type sugar transport system ATPase subunit